MRATIPALSLLLLPAADLSIDYTAERSLEVSIETEITSETTHMSMEIDGEPMEGGGRWGGGGGSEYTSEVVFTETYLEHDDGAPTKVRRSFDTVEATRTTMRGEESMDMDAESPMEDVTLIITLDDGEVVAEVDDGEAERSEMLVGHRIENLLHGLLPNGDDESWEPEGEAVLAALLIDLDGALFPPPEFEEGDGERGRGGRGRSMMRGGSPLGFLREAEWDTEASLTDRTEDVDGVDCLVIELTLEADGDMPERQFGRGGRDRALSLAPTERMLDNTFEIELTGYLYFSTEEHRPVMLELEGEFIQETLTERDTQRGSFRMERTQESTLEHTITLTSEDA